MIVELKMFETIFSFRKKNLINRISTNTTRDIKSLNLILGNPTKNRVQERKRELFNFATRDHERNWAVSKQIQWTRKSCGTREARRAPWDRKLLGQQAKIDAYFKASSRSLAVYPSLTELRLRTFFRNSACDPTRPDPTSFPPTRINNLTVFFSTFSALLFFSFFSFPFSRKEITLEIIEEDSYEKDALFYVELGEPQLQGGE